MRASSQCPNINSDNVCVKALEVVLKNMMPLLENAVNGNFIISA